MNRFQIAIGMLCVPLLWIPAGAQASSRVAPPVVHELAPLQGNLVKGLRYRDATGDNLVLISETEPFQRKVPGRKPAGWSRELHARRLLLATDGSVRQEWEMTDHVLDCEVDITAAFIQKAIRVTDLDGNGTAEIWLPYVLGCRGDIGPRTMKILMYEGGTKHALRGRTRASIGHGEFVGGEYTPDDAFSDAPAVFREEARRVWSEQMNFR